MSIENFSAVLGKLSENGGNPELDGPAFRVSTKVAEVMLSLGAAIARNAVRASPYYEETLDSAPVPAPLSLSELKEQVTRATSIAELRGLRRRFARCSHPDRHNDSEDSTATSEMAAANQLIDKAISSMRCPR
ncbi:MAG TPA: hypothetical protein VNR65_13905 [Geobacterales bacterium]|nr:hypothetical protein [Geobacterales bacterium]